MYDDAEDDKHVNEALNLIAEKPGDQKEEAKE